MTEPRLSVVIPAYNEATRILSTLDAVAGHLSAKPFSWEIVVVDDGSSDGTAGLVVSWARGEPRVRVESIPHAGKGWAVRAGMLAATGRSRFMCDADLAMPIAYLDDFLRRIDDGYDIVIGSREAEGARRFDEPALRHVMGRVFNWTVKAIAVSGIQDTQCGFKCFRAAAARRPLPPPARPRLWLRRRDSAPRPQARLPSPRVAHRLDLPARKQGQTRRRLIPDAPRRAPRPLALGTRGLRRHTRRRKHRNMIAETTARALLVLLPLLALLAACGADGTHATPSDPTPAAPETSQTAAELRPPTRLHRPRRRRKPRRVRPGRKRLRPRAPARRRPGPDLLPRPSRPGRTHRDRRSQVPRVGRHRTRRVHRADRVRQARRLGAGRRLDRPGRRGVLRLRPRVPCASEA